MLYFTLMAASMGLQQLKAWQDNKQKEALAKKQKEMRKAVQQREFDRARRLQAEAAKIAMEMEAEAHEQRRKDIENEYDNVFQLLIDQFQLDKWPLSVVPFIMKGESFGSHVRGFDVATVHCILTPSNDPNFNRFVYNSLDLRVEQMMNSNWNSNTTHQIVYYGGAWKPKAPNGVPTLDYSDVEKLHSELKSVPVICITPYFPPTGKMIFRVWVWGMGAETTARQDIAPFAKDFSISLNASSFVKPKDENADKEFTSSINSFINETANYLTAMIGYLTDMYYWKMYSISPILPQLMYGPLNQLPQYSLNEEYENFFTSEFNNDAFRTLSCLAQVKPYLNNKGKIETQISKTFLEKMETDTLFIGNVQDLRLSQIFSNSLSDDNAEKLRLNEVLANKLECINTYIQTIELSETSLNVVYKIINELSLKSYEAQYFFFTVWNENTIIGRFGSYNGTPSIYENINETKFFIFYSHPLIGTGKDVLSYNKYELKTNKILAMKDPNFEKRFGEEFARIGRAFGRTIDSLGKSSQKESVWESPSESQQSQTGSTDSYSQVITYFKSGVESNRIEFQHCENLSVQTFLDWIDKNNNPFATKAYVVKGYLADHKKYIYCIFFANDNRVFLTESDHKKCFITSTVSSEFSSSFGDNNLCVIPLKQ